MGMWEGGWMAGGGGLGGSCKMGEDMGLGDEGDTCI